jgi:Spy/CpxP family protein refolding chaperone
MDRHPHGAVLGQLPGTEARAHAIANFKDLNLTEDQKTKITDIRKEFRPKVQAKRRPSFRLRNQKASLP